MSDSALLILRLAYAALLLGFHGIGRFTHAFDYVAEGQPWPFVDIVAALGFPAAPAFAIASALSESVGAALVGLGWWTRGAAAAIAINMIVAAVNEAAKGDAIELPALYLFGALLFAFTGGGRYSADRWWADHARADRS